PPSLLYPGFAYLRPYSWDPTRLTPNGLFLLEPSVLSYYLALATTIELTVLRNISRLWLYLLAMLACLAVTGPAALVLASPLLLPGMQPGMRRALLLLIVPLAAAALLTGAFSPLLGRLGELGAVNSSGYGRIVAPLLAIADQATNDPNWLLGYGAGSSPRANNVVQWPFSKLMYEYGLIVAIVFHLYLLSCVFSERRSRAVVFVALLPYLFFGGGFVSHASVMPLLLLGSLLKVEEQNQAPVNDRTRS
ncbi:MAG: O-antigen ligase like rane protein, partial [Hyphomicrobiales bacterium]|nr:O-antigen ligase like rane protein [Hyphomicrobiales bacterium]